ncbi:hypothetical protein MKW98_003671 [Papaver atlanticum]|uniref:non-specific serine/threonine protein kinase n=1 Tax=Papaver atlanticum TaxID=357466 RepID=A0AAD4SHJ5_9MAGN|nr:hypothetical protein MKW98_003671 [Papaver atlanticum]
MVNIIGADRFHGRDTCGVLPDGMKITVKQIDEHLMFKNEVKFLSTLRHPNLVRLLGHCTENNQQLLVYEYMENSSLSNALSGDNENLRKRLNWRTKMRICLGIANGLAFLHQKDESKATIVHRNVQLRNIFLGKFLDPKISYFDLTLSNSLKEATMLLDLAMLCTYESPELRPFMSEVVNILEGSTTMKTPPVDPLYATTFSCEDFMSVIKSASSSSSYTKLTHDGFVYNPIDDWDGDDASLSYQVASKVKENNTRPELHNDFVSDLKGFLSEGGEGNETQETYETPTFSLRYIEVATGNFNPANKIGQGSSGSVYKGMVRNGKMIAVKQLSLKSSDQGKVVFLNEVNTISTLRHPNIIRLLGHCIENNQHLLVYEYMENECLNRAIFGPVNLKNKLSWPARLRICTGIAKGLAYLHDDNSKMKIVHREIKLSNILLDKDLNPKISDFGLTMNYNSEITYIKTGLAGTV